MHINADVQNCTVSPISEVTSWLENPDDPDVINVCQAVPSYSPPPDMLSYMGELARSGTAGEYTDIEGIKALRTGLARDINIRYNGDVHPDELLITAGCNQGFCSVIDAICQRGDNVLLPLPCYFNHEMWLTIRGIEARWLAVDSENAIPDPQQVEALVDSRTRAICLVTPNNPTGAIYPPEVIEGFFEACRQHDPQLIVDETYRDFMDDSKPPHELFQNPQWREHFIHLYSFSKSFSLTGYRVGAVAASEQLMAHLLKIQDCVAICSPHLGQKAAAYGLEHLIPWRRERGLELINRVGAIRSAFDKPGLNYRIVSAGAYFAWVKHPFDESALTVARRLAEEFNIACLPGNYFGDGQEQFFRFAFSNIDESRFPELVERLITSQ